ncbi:undecaprenyldiphospho-muramoylpentapeptide beta-N-acetylglucosaminyltransferase [Kribbella sindirgiensis]|uniref:UDP-N-acetylglucosamine--N-acetylmuramyl-(pentapeptide) pyrophosphoryl-undecaprenol N-acetylglucosamine transferase n=1 Tax=Kribbella sindirgiensis TaxID=1124744 RepID=A0A4R0ILX9_9ACTN|nr:undecaprenyldiphospho-muramoylpentapeptide beta-N-acetylglucosaminyltransferase [Kribbella sindirgiensis]TCC33360.1 undecaprenyldiphospho-muramoylpentapeptide beta-N-acetylglucosaminyltransferase [Kribbella sindirgiensis]
MPSIVLAGGGSAGHTSPLIATADALRRIDPTIEIIALGTERGLETRVIPEAGYRLELIPPVPLPRKPTPALLAVPGKLLSSVSAARKVLDEAKADVLVGFGGYVSTPAYVAAWRRKTPIVVHEGNAVPGIANKFAARYCTEHVKTSFPGTELPHAEYVGLPIRRAISTLDRAALRAEARRFFGLDPDAPTLFVTGGSQGAQRINESVSGAAADLQAAGIQVLHAIGPKNTLEMPREIAETGPLPYVVLNYVDRMDLAYAAADLVVCRSGANTVTEVSGVGLPAIYVPLPIGNGEQRLNAKPVVDVGGGVLIDNAELSVDWVRANVPQLLLDRERLTAMSTAATGVIRTDADDRLARIILDVVRSAS